MSRNDEGPARERRALEQFEAFLLSQVEAAIVATDNDGRVINWNPHAETLFGWTSEEAIGLEITALLQVPEGGEDLGAALTQGRAGQSWEGDLELVAKHGRVFVHVTTSPINDERGKVTGFAAVCVDISKRKRAEDRLSVQNAVASALSRSDTLQEASPEILRAVCEHLDWELGAVWVVDRESAVLRCVELWRSPASQAAAFEELTRDIELPVGIGLPGRVWELGRPVWIEDVVEDPNFPRAAVARRERLHGAFGFPILLRTHVVGVIEFFSSRVREPETELLDMMAAIGGQLGQFIERKQAEDTALADRARKSAIVESALDCIISMDHRGIVVEFNPAAEKTFGYRREEVIGREMAELIIPPSLRDRHRKGLAKYLRTGEGPVIGNRIEITAMRADGSEFLVELAIARVDLPGPPLFTGYLRDITARKNVEGERARLLRLEREARAEAEAATAKLEKLQRITEVALGHLTLEDMLAELLGRISTILEADAATILLVSENGQFLTVRASHGLDPHSAAQVNIPIGERIAGRIAASGEPLIIDDVLALNLDSPIFLGSSIRSFIGVPLLVETQVAGVLLAGTREPRHFSQDDSNLLALAADRIATPIQNARLYEREHRIAGMLQKSLLPPRLPATSNVDMAARYVAGGPGTVVGGDWYDALWLDDGRLALAIGDVVGKGIRAATVMGQLRNSLRAYAVEGHSPQGVVERLNRLSEDLDRTSMATLIYATFQPQTGIVELVNAGHPPPLIVAPDGTDEFAEGAKGLPLGTMPDVPFPSLRVILEPGALMLFYTDGLIERRDATIDEGMARLRAAALDAPEDLDAACDHILAQVFVAEGATDDVAVIALRPRKTPAPLKITIPADPNALTELRRVLRGWLKDAAAADDEMIFEMSLACSEAAANSIEHGYGGRKGVLEVSAAVEDGEVEVLVRDHGTWRTPEVTDRGRGISLMESFMDVVTVTPREDGTDVRMRRRIARRET